MPALTPQFLFDFESRMQAITEDEYSRLLSNLWWSQIMKTMQSTSKKEMVAWLMSTAQIEDLGKKGGNMPFEDLVSNTTEFENRYAGAGLRLLRQQVEDTDGKGLELAAHWSKDIGTYMAYWPQKKLAEAMKNGELATSTGYDGLPFYSKSHPLKPGDPSKTYANLLSGAAASTPSTDPNDAGYPGAIVIGDSVTVDVALQNLAKLRSYIASIKMPNGVDPRFLRPSRILAPPALMPRLVQLTGAKTIAQAAAGGAGTNDVEGLIKFLNYATPIEMDELAGYESDSTFFVVAEQITSSQLGAFVYVDREPFNINYYSGQEAGATGLDAILNRAEELEWHCKGRNVVGYGHPYLIFKVKAT